jgi:hypothetical protein
MILLKMDICFLCYNIYTDVVNEIGILESDVADCEKKCKNVNCSAIYEAIMASLKLLYDLMFMCVKRKT